MEYTICFTWDDEANIWIATSEDIPGLVLEGESFDSLLDRTRLAVPELLALNSTPCSPLNISFVTERHERIAL